VKYQGSSASGERFSEQKKLRLVGEGGLLEIKQTPTGGECRRRTIYPGQKSGLAEGEARRIQVSEQEKKTKKKGKRP